MRASEQRNYGLTRLNSSSLGPPFNAPPSSPGPLSPLTERVLRRDWVSEPDERCDDDGHPLAAVAHGVADGAHAAEHQVAELLVAVEAEAGVEELVVDLVDRDRAQALRGGRRQ